MTITFTFRHADADLEQIQAVVEQLRQKAIDLGLTGISGLVCLSGDELASHEFGDRFKLVDENISPVLPQAVCFFDAKLPDGQPMEIGVALYEMFDGWTWSGMIQSRDMLTVALVMEAAAELGIEAVMFCGGMFFRHWRDESGQVQYEQDWAVDWHNFCWLRREAAGRPGDIQKLKMDQFLCNLLALRSHQAGVPRPGRFRFLPSLCCKVCDSDFSEEIAGGKGKDGRLKCKNARDLHFRGSGGKMIIRLNRQITVPTVTILVVEYDGERAELDMEGDVTFPAGLEFENVQLADKTPETVSLWLRENFVAMQVPRDCFDVVE